MKKPIGERGFPAIILRGEYDLKVGQTENIKRSSHRDFKTSAELKKDTFSGIRHNSLSDRMEIWVEGEVRASVSRLDMQLYPDKFDTKYREVFGMFNKDEVGE